MTGEQHFYVIIHHQQLRRLGHFLRKSPDKLIPLYELVALSTFAYQAKKELPIIVHLPDGE